MSLTNILLSTKPRENSGSETDRRYNYQKDLSLYMLIELHKVQEDYVMLFDYHDDIVLLNSETEPNQIDFFQVKTKGSGYWLLSNLISSTEDKLSILGKLFKNKINFQNYTKSLNFVSNAPLNLVLKSNKNSCSLTEFDASDLIDTDIIKVNNKLKDEHTLSYSPTFEEITKFWVSPLSLKDSATHCSGALNILFEKLNPNYAGNPNLAYKKIFNEIKIKTDQTINETKKMNIKEIFTQKGISKREFDELLRVAGLYKNTDQIWSEIALALNNAGAGVIAVKNYKSIWREANIKLLNQASNIPLQKTLEYVTNVVKECLENSDLQNLNILSIIEAIEANCTNLPYSIFDSKFIKGIILKVIYND